MNSLKIFTGSMLLWAVAAYAQQPVIDAHIHYSHDAWKMLPPLEAIRVLRKAGLKKAFVSSSSDDGTQMLYQAGPDIVVPVLRPYRQRGEISTWYHDQTVVDLLAGLLKKNTYAGIGEFHVFGDDANLPVMQEVVKLAKKYQIFLHAHSDSAAVDNIFKQNPDARVLWAHSGFDRPENIRMMLKKYPNLWCDLAFRSEQAAEGKVNPEWRALFDEFPDRFMVGTDTYTPERWYYVIDHAQWSRDWIKGLPEDLAKKISYQNAEALLAWALKEK